MIACVADTIVVKPPEQGPLSSLRLAELIDGILPPGVWNLVPGGKEVGQVLASHPDVAKVALIGSVPTGRAVMRAASDTLKPVLLELDRDLKRTATDAMRTQLAGLGDIAQQAQGQLNSATGQIGTGIGALQTKVAALSGSMGAGITPSSGVGDASRVVQASPASGNEHDAVADEKLWAEELLAYQKF